MAVTANPTELLMQRRQTRAIINARAVQITISRVNRVRNERGGLSPDSSASELPPQTVCILHAPPRRRRLENNPPHQSLAEVPFSKDMVMGFWDMDIQMDDKFLVDDVQYTVAYVFQDRDYETIANLNSTTQAKPRP